MAKVSKLEVLQELKDTKVLLYGSLDTLLGNVKATKEEFERLKESLKGYPDFVIERELDLLNVKKKLQTVLSEANFHAQLDIGIKFLDDLLLDSKPE